MAPHVHVTSPDKLYFPSIGATKADVVAYYAAVGEHALQHLRERPIVLKRFPDGIDGKSFFQKRAPSPRPPWVRTVEYRFPSGRSADEIVVDRVETLLFCVQLGNVEFHAHPVRAGDVDHPDELRIDLDPGPGVGFADVRTVAGIVREVLDELGLAGWPKTSGSRGLHVYASIEPHHDFADVRRAALAVAREVERRAPRLVTTRWWKEERHGVFVDYNQNARDRTMAAALSLRARPAAPVSMPLAWDDVQDCDPADFTIRTVPSLLRANGDPSDEARARHAPLEPLLELAERQEAAGADEAPLPPFHPRRKPAALRTIARAETEAEALEGLRRWRERHPKAAAHVRAEHVLVDSMRGRSSTWTRVRVNLRDVPEELRPPVEAPDPDRPGR